MKVFIAEKIWIKGEHFDDAMKKVSAEQCVNFLVDIMFTKEEISCGNLTGMTSHRKGKAASDTKVEKLDPKKIEGIVG